MSAVARTPQAQSLLTATTAQDNPADGDAHYGALAGIAVVTDGGTEGAPGHPARVGATAAAIARQLGLGPFTATWLGQAAPLHDIGKLVVPDAILAKPTRLSAAEFTIVQGHTRAGARLLSGSGSRLLGLAREVALNHHERWDGGGYPNGLCGEAIPLSARIVAIADVFDALTHARPYKDAWSIERAVAEISRQRGAHFDPDVVDAFEAVVGRIAFGPPELVVLDSRAAGRSVRP